MKFRQFERVTAAIPLEKRIAYNMAEFEALKKEIATLAAQTTADLRYAIMLSGVVIAWLVTKPEASNVFAHAKFIPLIVAVLFGGHSWICHLHMGEKGEYLAELERRLSLSGLGWEKRYRARISRVGLMVAAIWCILIVGDIVVAYTLQSAACAPLTAMTKKDPTTRMPPGQ